MIWEIDKFLDKQFLGYSKIFSEQCQFTLLQFYIDNDRFLRFVIRQWLWKIDVRLEIERLGKMRIFVQMC